MPKFTDAVGFSKLDCFRECPQKFKFQFIDKLPQPSSPALERGSALHDACETYVRGWSKELPESLERWKEGLDYLISMKAVPELAWGFDKDWNLLPNWLDKSCWLRVKLDVYFFLDEETLVVIDYKSGKYRVPSQEQNELYAISGHAAFPHVKKVITAYWFLDQTEAPYETTYMADHLVLLRKKYEDYFAPLFEEEEWAPTPSRNCRWCSYAKHNGGKCEY